jgi:hypothetical protein
MKEHAIRWDLKPRPRVRLPAANEADGIARLERRGNPSQGFEV